MEQSAQQESLDYLNSLIGQPLRYALKSPDTELYDFGFGELVEVVNRHGKHKDIGTYILHILCRFKVIWRNGEHRIDKYYEDTPSEAFHFEVKRLLGLKVIRVALSDKNDLWLDFGDCWVVFATFETGEESWRFFTHNLADPYLVASDSWLDLNFVT